MTSKGSRVRFHLTREKLEEILRNVGVKVVAETEHDLLCYCPFHHNVDSPAFNISKRQPYPWKCWNGSCAQKGNIFTLLYKKGYSPAEVKKILVQGEVEPNEFLEFLEQILKEEEEQVNPWKGYDYTRFAEDDKNSGYPARDYVLDRGITEEAYEHFHMGYSAKKDMLIIPAFHDNGEMAGVIGRSIKGKQYRYSNGLQRGTIIWNLNNAPEYQTDEIILTEGSLDAIYVWQAGHRNVGAVLGSAVSPQQWKVIRKHCGAITCFFDNDDAGKALQQTIINNTRDLMVSAVEYPDRLITLDDGTERPIKDPGELTLEEIQHMVFSRKTALQFLLS